MKEVLVGDHNLVRQNKERKVTKTVSGSPVGNTIMF